MSNEHIFMNLDLAAIDASQLKMASAMSICRLTRDSTVVIYDSNNYNCVIIIIINLLLINNGALMI